MSDAVMPWVRTCFLRFNGLEGDESTGKSTLASLRISRRALVRLPGEAMVRMESVKSLLGYLRLTRPRHGDGVAHAAASTSSRFEALEEGSRPRFEILFR